MTNIPRLRTLPEAVEMIKAEDPQTGINITNLRRMAKNGEIKTIMTGNKYLVDYDSLIQSLCARTS